MTHWEIRHLRTRLAMFYRPHRFEWAWQVPEPPTTRLHGHHFDLICPENDQEQAEPLLAALDAWAERIRVDGRTVFGRALWTEGEVGHMLERYLDVWHSTRPSRPPLDVAPPSTAVAATYCPDCDRPPGTAASAMVAERCRTHEVSVAGAADRAAESALVLSDLVVAFSPGITWADINRDFCRFLHRDRDKLPHAR